MTSAAEFLGEVQSPYIYMVFWTGGYEDPTVKSLRDYDEARDQTRSWAQDMESGEVVAVYKIDLLSLETRLYFHIWKDDDDGSLHEVYA
jgi:hypothetical protein